MNIPNFKFYPNLEGEIEEEQHFFKLQKGETPISPLLIDLEGWFFHMIYNFWFTGLKKGKFCVVDFSTPPPPKLGHNWILTQKSWEPQKAHVGLLLHVHT